MSHATTQRHFDEAVDALVTQVKDDRSVLAALLCGSLSHDRVWKKSDVDLVLITIDDKKVSGGGISPANVALAAQLGAWGLGGPRGGGGGPGREAPVRLAAVGAALRGGVGGGG